MSKALKGVGIGGGITDTVMETWHAAEAIRDQVERKSAGWLEYILSMDEVTLIGDVTLIFLLFATWIPIFATLLKRFTPSVEIPILSLGMFGSTISSILISKYAATVFYTHYHGATSWFDLYSMMMNTEEAAKVGLAMYFFLFIATWIPPFLLIKKWAKHNEMEKEKA